jgi:SAM-dependent methyltransferase
VNRIHVGDGVRDVGGPRQPLMENHWHAYWDRLEEHVIFRVEAADYLSRLEAALGPQRGARVLDFGCGFGFLAELLAPKVTALFVFDASDHMRRRAQLRLAGHANVRILGPPAAESWPEDLRFDLILVNSVVQYMTPDVFHGWLARWRTMLAPGGRLVLSDLLIRDVNPLREVAELLAMSARGGCLLSVVWKAMRELPHYTRTRDVQPLYRIALGDLRERARRLGLAMDVRPTNLTYRSTRATAVLSAAPHR